MCYITDITKSSLSTPGGCVTRVHHRFQELFDSTVLFNRWDLRLTEHVKVHRKCALNCWNKAKKKKKASYRHLMHFDTHNTALLTVALLLIYFFALTACPNNKYFPSPRISGHRLVSFGVIDVKVLLKPTLHAFWRGEQEIGPSQAERCIPITQRGSEPLVESGFVA